VGGPDEEPDHDDGADDGGNGGEDEDGDLHAPIMPAARLLNRAPCNLREIRPPASTSASSSVVFDAPVGQERPWPLPFST
jgi:hypothetical protein